MASSFDYTAWREAQKLPRQSWVATRFESLDVPVAGGYSACYLPILSCIISLLDLGSIMCSIV